MFYVAWYGKLLVECGVWGCRVLLLCLSICTVFFTVHTHPHPFNGPFPGLPGWAGTRKAKPIWILLKQETLSGNGISWAICKSAPRSRQITTPAPHHSVFYRPDALPAAQSTTSKHWRHEHWRHCTCFLKFIGGGSCASSDHASTFCALWVVAISGCPLLSPVNVRCYIINILLLLYIHSFQHLNFHWHWKWQCSVDRSISRGVQISKSWLAPDMVSLSWRFIWPTHFSEASAAYAKIYFPKGTV